MGEISNSVAIKLEFEVEKDVLLLDLTSLLYDFELLHDFLVLSILEDYSKYRFAQYFWYRYGRPLEDIDKLRVVEIVKRSPMTIVIAVGGYVASQILLPLLTVTEKISNWKLNRRKLELEVEKLQLDVESARMDRYLSLHAQRVFEVVEEKGQVELERAKVELDKAQLEREKLRTQVSILKRLEKNPIRLIDMSLMVMESEDKKGEGKEMTESGEEKSS